MEKSAQKSLRLEGIDTQEWRDFFAARHPAKTAACVAARTGISQRTVEHWLAGRAAPGAGHFCKLAAAYGPEFLALALPACGWLSEAARGARAAALDDEIARLTALRSELLERN